MPAIVRHIPMTICAVFVGALMAVPAKAAKPTTMGSNTIRIEYETTGGPANFMQTLGYGGATPQDAVNLDAATNVGAFNSVNDFGRRTAVLPGNSSVSGENESLVTHAFFKVDGNQQFDPSLDFFPEIDPESDITITVEDIQFDQPVSIVENSFLMHLFWNGLQVDSLGLDDQNQPRAYDNLHNHYIPPDFRDLDEFIGTGRPFTNDPIPNFATFDQVTLADLDPQFNMTGVDTFDLSFTFPYELLQHLQDDGMGVPQGSGLPAPGGFLEPFHFHLEYLVTPEPSALTLVALGGLCATRRRRSAPGRGCQ